MRKLIFIITIQVISFWVISQNAHTLYFEPNYATGAAQSRIFENINYIPLETTKESLFGRVAQLVVTPEYFVVLDNDTKAIYFFNKSGRFIKKHNDKKYEPRTIQLDKQKNALFITSRNKAYNPTQTEIQQMMDNPLDKTTQKYIKAYYYSLNDVAKENITTVNNFEIAFARPVIFNTNQWVYSHIYANRKWADATDYELKITDGNKIISGYFPYNKQKASLFYGSPEAISFYRTLNDNTLLFTRPYNYSIYELTADSASLLYTLILPFENSLPKTFFTQSFETANQLADYKMKNAAYVWGLNNIVSFNNYLFFTLDSYKSIRERRFMFDKKSNQFYNIDKIAPDSLNTFLPIIGNGIQYFDKDYLYTSISSVNMFQAKENNKNRQLTYNTAIENYFTKSKPVANPVIIQLKPKTN